MGIMQISKSCSARIRSFVFLGITGITVIASAQDPLLILRSNGLQFDEAIDGLEAELSDEFTFHQMTIKKGSTAKQIGDNISKTGPKVVVLMDNRSIKLFKKYQEALPKKTSSYIPSVALMGILIKHSLEGIKNTSGIAYEVPIVTSAVNLRSIWGKDIKKVGVICRELANDFLTENKEYCKREGIEIASCVLPNKMGSPKSEVRKGLKKLFAKDKINALWVSNDNVLFSAEIVRDVWIPFAKKYKKPIVVGVENLVEPKFNIGAFGVIPDHVGLGKQAANLIYQVKDQDWQFNKTIVQPPISVYKIINQKMAKEYWGLSDKDFNAIDKVLK